MLSRFAEWMKAKSWNEVVFEQSFSVGFSASKVFVVVGAYYFGEFSAAAAVALWLFDAVSLVAVSAAVRVVSVFAARVICAVVPAVAFVAARAFAAVGQVAAAVAAVTAFVAEIGRASCRERV